VNPDRVESFRQGLRELGYVEGKSIAIEYRYVEGRLDRLSDLAAELVRLKVSVIVTGDPLSTRAAKKATSTIPTVMARDTDPVGNGFVASLAQPGGNITGLSSFATVLAGKRLELLKEAIPRLSRIALVWDPRTSATTLLKETAGAAGSLKVQLISVEVRRGLDELENAFRSTAKSGADAFILGGSGFFATHRSRIIELAAKNRLPAMYPEQEYVLAGGLMTYATSIPSLYRRAATYVDKMLKGAKPADLPVEQPTKFELVINLKTAKALGLTIPQSVLLRADEVIQ
jgi:ABC-type uncharacterized transport system substrate-binding protein